jgi:2-hydroxy-3-oxopropionate reductase
MNTRQTRLGIIGIGVMGSAIASRLLECGHSLTLYDADPAKIAPFLARGASAADSAAALTRSSDSVITSLNTAAIVEAVVFGPGGVRDGAAPDKLLIDMSSIDPQATAAMAARLKTETGMSWVDAPLSGGAPAASAGRLTLMIGGEADPVVRAQAILGALAANMTHMGPNGAGQTTKLINQVLCACNFLAVAEATRLARDGGVEAAKIPAALAGGLADSAGIHAQDGGLRLLPDRPDRQHAEGLGGGATLRGGAAHAHAADRHGHGTAPHDDARRVRRGGQCGLHEAVRLRAGRVGNGGMTLRRHGRSAPRMSAAAGSARRSHDLAGIEQSLRTREAAEGGDVVNGTFRALDSGMRSLSAPTARRPMRSGAC